MSLFLSDSLPAASVVLPRIQAQLRDNQLRRQDLLGNTSVMPSKMRTLHNQDLLRRYPITLRGLKQVRECLRCKQIYTLCSALGQWQCKYAKKNLL